MIVPEGPLWDLPFQALTGLDGRFVIERFAVNYAPSLTVLRALGVAAPTGTTPTAVLAFGNPAGGVAVEATSGAADRSTRLASLPSAAAEARALRQLYGAASRAYTGSDATEARLKRESPQFSIIHLATHGILNNTDPMSSHLVLTPDARIGATEDGRLQAREILSLDLVARLAVLSGCDTARGRAGAGEGVIGLSWAFFVAGVPTTVVSQWAVDSESTAQLMIGFHRRLATDRTSSPAAALRSSARAMLATPRFRHPFYWAGFVVIGDGLRPI